MGTANPEGAAAKIAQQWAAHSTPSLIFILGLYLSEKRGNAILDIKYPNIDRFRGAVSRR